MQESFGRHTLKEGAGPLQISFSDQKLVVSRESGTFIYRRYSAGEVAAEATIVSDKKHITFGIFPIVPFLTPKRVAKNVYIKFKSPIIIDQRSDVVIYTKIPIEIGVYRQSDDEELLIDAFSLARQRYALYGSPEIGIVCRFIEADISTTENGITVEKFSEARIRIRISNGIDNVIKISKLVIPMDGVVLDHAHDESWIPGGADVRFDTAFGKDIVNVRLETKSKRVDKTSVVKRPDTLLFMMDAGY